MTLAHRARTRHYARRRAPRWVRAGTPNAALATLAALAVLVGLASCTTVRSWTGLMDDLEAEGFSNVSVNIETSDQPYTLAVRADSPPGESTAKAQDAAAEVVWDTYPSRFEKLRLTIDGESEDYTRAELTEQFGKRPAHLDEGTLEDDITRDSISVLIAVLVVGMIVVLITAVMALFILRARRAAAVRRRAAWEAAPSPPWAPTGATAPPPDAATPATTPTPVPPPVGWVPAAAPVPPGSPGPGYGPPPPPREWDVPADPVERKLDARRYGRRPRGPKPAAANLPPGWDN